MKKITALALAVLMVLALCACGSTETAAAPAAEEAAAAPAEAAAFTEPTKDEPVVSLNGEFKADLGKGSVLVTSVGQSADAAMMENILKKAGVEFTSNTSATADDLSGVGTIIVVAGASTKGLGAAGISTEDELARAQELLAACKENGISVILTHIGGSARRGSLSDQFTQLVMDNADCMLVVNDGEYDGNGTHDQFFSNYAAANSIPLTLLNNVAACVEPLTNIFA